MAYNYGAPPSSFGRPPSYGGFPGAPTNLGPAPNTVGAPGMAPAPGMDTAQSPVQNGIPNFANMNLPPGLNFNASVIRMTGQQQPQRGGGGRPGAYDGGRDGPGGNRGRAGLGMDSGRSRENNIQPLTKEEVSRTIYIGGLVDGTPGDMELEDLLNVGRGLRRWTRVVDADGKQLDFGFAEYEDAASLEIAAKLFEDVQVPLKKDGKIKKDESDAVVNTKLIVIVDPQSQDYIKQWTKGESDEFQFKMDGAQDDLRSFIASYTNRVDNGEDTAANGAADAAVDFGAQAAEAAEFLAIPANGEDELSDIPADMREMVAAEIAAFRERSNQRDLERLRIEEEVEKAEREKSRGSRINRLASPPPSAIPRGPGALNGVPSGPRGAPTGPKFRGLQIPKDYANGVAFTAGSAGDEEDDDTPDEELEARRQRVRDDELEKIYLEQEKKWLAKEKVHAAAVERQQKEDDQEKELRSRMQAELLKRLDEFDDSDETKRKDMLFYKDRKEWHAERRTFRNRERRSDDQDRRAEQNEQRMQRHRADDERGGEKYREDFGRDLRSQKETAEKQAFSLNLGGFGAANGATKDASADVPKSRQTMAEMENLLDDEDADAAGALERRPLKTMEFKPLAAGEKMTDEERKQASNDLAKSIPNDVESLFGWEIKWEHLPDQVITDQLRPYVQRKIMEALGVQEELLVSSIEEIIRKHGSAQDVVRELEETLDEEAEMVTRRVWKMVVFYSESGARGLLEQ